MDGYDHQGENRQPGRDAESIGAGCGRGASKDRSNRHIGFRVGNGEQEAAEEGRQNRAAVTRGQRRRCRYSVGEVENIGGGSDRQHWRYARHRGEDSLNAGGHHQQHRDRA
ncbi:hypothetical protein X770_04485 [Mesorhizobium sp. LSJC269B00]|nr:hypothetical protein X770_04485 [Mesorhizobium sp. LSJC269B00]